MTSLMICISFYESGKLQHLFSIVDKKDVLTSCLDNSAQDVGYLIIIIS